MSTPEHAQSPMVLDNRGLEPPQPMMRVLEALGSLADSETLVAINDREPMFLYPQLAARGYQHETAAHPDGGFRIVIWHEPSTSAASDTTPTSTAPTEERPAVVLDVREELRQRNEPFAQIMAAIRGLPTEQDLMLVSTFEPIPLYTVLERQGFAHVTRQLGPEEWHIRFSRTSARA
jgi:tRNA 2-thiouridine synthesizing protein A